VGTRSYEYNFEKGLVFETVAGKPVLQWQFDGNHVVASSLARPWRTQLNLLLAYALFYNPVNLVRSVLRPRGSLYLAGALEQLKGMIGLWANAIDSARWAYRLWRGPITRQAILPGPRTPLIDVSGPRAEQPTATALQRSQPPELVQIGTSTTADPMTTGSC
jgi:hypothetical protein